MGNQQTNVSRRELDNWRSRYNLPPDKASKMMKAFKEQKTKAGVINKDQFVQYMVLQASADEEFAKAIFASFDKDGSGTIDIREYMALVGVSFGDNMEEKLKASFDLFDEDGSGTLERREIEKMIELVIKATIRRSAPPGSTIVLPPTHKQDVDKMLDEIFEKVDTDKNGTLDFAEFKQGFLEHPDICQFFRQF